MSAGGAPGGPVLVVSRSYAQEVSGKMETSILATSSGSSTPSPTTAGLRCRAAIDAGGPEDGLSLLARLDSGSLISSPALDGGIAVSALRMEGEARDYGLGGGVQLDGIDFPPLIPR
ncbi:hypothetical protein Dimus_001141 [Dionaea muscipula]